MYRATIKFKKFEQSGWDRETSYYTVTVEHKILDILHDMVADQIHKESYTSKGDFGIILADVEHVSTDYSKIVQSEVVEAI